MKKINLKFIQRTIKRFKEHGTVEIKRKTGRKRSVRTKKLLKCVREKIRRDGSRSYRKLASEHNISKSSMELLVKNDLKLKAFKKTRRHGLTSKNIQDRKRKCKLLLERHANSNIVFSDEKLFLLQPSLNSQNDRMYAASSMDIPQHKKTIQRFQNVKKVMVWGAISKDVKFPLIFVEENVKVTAKYYKREILKKNLLPYANRVFENNPWVFQQDGAPSHTAKIVQQWLRANVPDFIEKDAWPASSPDLNPLDYFVWGYMLSQLKTLEITNKPDLEEFKSFLTEIWGHIPMEMVRAACTSFPQRLRRVIRANGERFE